ncbi:MAG: NADH-quinone oxidoreductase subunit NuoH [Deltaproteobacteria bacterium]|nr:NADH-quinone oxidoreductase subunit NuoH [Deltaproteobacteria bacterium]
MELLITLLKVLIIPMLVINLIPLLIWMERKVSAYIQDRRGPNRAAILGVRLGGLIHNIADVIKLFTKEDIVPAGANKFYFILAPAILMFVSFVAVAVIPFADTITLNDGNIFSFQLADLNVGLLYILAISSLSVYSILLAGWSSNNKYAFLGGLRASSQMISYEITMGLAVVAILMLAGSASLNDIVRDQGPLPWHWNIFRQPLAFFLFLAASYAETNRTPFDLPEGESEIVAGYHVEYSSMKFALFFMGEYAAMVIASAVTASLFLGGWQVPFFSTEALRVLAPDFLPPVAFAALVQATVFLAKILFFCFLFVWVRWTLPRFRYDQLMRFGWQFMLPLALFNILVTGVWLLIVP